MNAKSFGATIAALRRKKGYTQAELAEHLSLSNKTVSKWENGQGYPDITTLPTLAKLFGVTVDELLSEEKSGIAVAGTVLVDIVHNIDRYPTQGMLANILSSKQATGGCMPNTTIDLAVIDNKLPLSVWGCVGDDEYGRYILSTLQSRGIDVSGISVSGKYPTSFSNVMSLPTGERTFFSLRGANAAFSPSDVDIAALRCKLFHVGYILMMDKFDEEDAEYGTVMARFLHNVQEHGIKTSVDVVSSSNTEDYAKKIIPALPYTDYVIINEVEVCNMWGLDPRLPDGSPNVPAIREAMQKTMARGVGEKVVIHAKEAGFCLNKDGTFSALGSLKIPSEKIAGSVGAGDAFCAGCLYAIYNDMTDEQMLEFASASAACSLFAENAVDGMRNKNDIAKLAESFERYSI